MAPPPRRYCRDFLVGEIAWQHTDLDTGCRAFVVRGPLSFLAYVGVPMEHWLASDEDEAVTFFAQARRWGQGDGKLGRSGDWSWWGWDYGSPRRAAVHAPGAVSISTRTDPLGDRDLGWTVEEAILDASNALSDLVLACQQCEDRSEGRPKA